MVCLWTRRRRRETKRDVVKDGKPYRWILNDASRHVYWPLITCKERIAIFQSSIPSLQTAISDDDDDDDDDDNDGQSLDVGAIVLDRLWLPLNPLIIMRSGYVLSWPHGLPLSRLPIYGSIFCHCRSLSLPLIHRSPYLTMTMTPESVTSHNQCRAEPFNSLSVSFWSPRTLSQQLYCIV